MSKIELNQAYDKYMSLSQQIKALVAQQDEIKKSLIAEHGDNDSLHGDVYQSKLVACTRKTLLEAEVQKKYGVTFVPEDYRRTEYKTFKVSLVKPA